MHLLNSVFQSQLISNLYADLGKTFNLSLDSPVDNSKYCICIGITVDSREDSRTVRAQIM